MKKKDKRFAEGHDEMIGRGSFANMPQDVIMKEYPKNKGARGGYMDDTITGVDEVIRGSEGKTSRYMSNQK